MVSDPKKSFGEELIKEETQFDLAHAALLLAQHLAQSSDLTSYLANLDKMAETVRPAVEAALSPTGKIEALNFYLFDHLRFRGNIQDYYNPHNSFLNRVLDFKRGIPISLSVIYLEMGWRLKLPVWGIGMPGHFIVGWGPLDQPLYIDVFNRGQIVTETECLALSNLAEEHRLIFREQFLRPMTKKDILFRMLLNLKQIYIQREDWPAAYRTVDLMLLVRPDQVNELRDRGLLAYRLDRLQEAIFDLNRYLFLFPDNPDKAWLETRLELMEERLLQIN